MLGAVFYANINNCATRVKVNKTRQASFIPFPRSLPLLCKQREHPFSIVSTPIPSNNTLRCIQMCSASRPERASGLLDNAMQMPCIPTPPQHGSRAAEPQQSAPAALILAP